MRSELIGAMLVLCAAEGFAQAFAGGGDQLFQNAIGGRIAAMGGAGAAAAHDASAIYYNPAGLGLMPASEFQLMRSNYYEGAALNSLVYGHSFQNAPAGAALQLIQFGVSGAQGTNSMNAQTGAFGYSELAATAGLGMRGVLLPDLSVGSSVKILTQDLGGSSDRLMGVDVGAQYGPLFNDTLTLGSVIHNIISVSQGATSDTLPTNASVGAAWHPLHALTLTAEMTTTGVLSGGAEWAWNSVALRAGYDGLQGITFGGGLNFRKSFSFDVAMVNNSVFGLSEKASLGYRFGSNAPPHLPLLAENYIKEARADIERGDYENALKNVEIAIGFDPHVDDGHWHLRGERLKELLTGAEVLGQPRDAEELASKSVSSNLTRRAVKDIVYGGDTSSAMILLHVAAGAGGPGSVYMRLLTSAAAETRQAVVSDDILPPNEFIDNRMRTAYDDVYARRFESAVRACLDALVINPNNVLAWERLGSAYFALGDAANARKAYDRALILEPTNGKLLKFYKENFPQ